MRRTRAAARAERSLARHLGPDEIHLVHSWLGGSDLRRAAAASKLWRECAKRLFGVSEWQARACTLPMLLRRVECSPEAVRLHVEARPSRPPSLQELEQLVVECTAAQAHVRNASHELPFEDLYGRGASFLVINLGMKLKFVFDLILVWIGHLTQSDEGAGFDASRSDAIERCAIYNLFQLGDELHRACRRDESISVWREHMKRVTARLQTSSSFEGLLYDSMCNLACVLDDNLEVTEAIALHRQALAGRRRLYDDPCDPNVLASMCCLAGALARDRQYVEAEALHREELALSRLAEEEEDTLKSIRNLADMLYEQAESCWQGRELATAKATEALALYREAIPMAARSKPTVLSKLKLQQEEVQTLALLHGTDAGMLRTMRGLVRALRKHHRTNREEGFDPLTDGLIRLSGYLKELGKLSEAEAVLRELLEMLRERPKGSVDQNEGYTSLDQALFFLGDCLMAQAHQLRGPARQEKLQQAMLAYRESNDELAREEGPTDADSVVTMGRLAEALLEHGDLEEATSVMADVWHCWEPRVVSKISLETIRNHPDTMHLHVCTALIEHARLARGVETGEVPAMQVDHAFQKIGAQVDRLQTLYPAGERDWMAVWAREALERARERGRVRRQ